MPSAQTCVPRNSWGKPGRPIFQPESKDVLLGVQCRNQAGEELERFIDDHIARLASFAFETTLRPKTFDQIRHASRAGFHVELTFIAAGGKKEHTARVEERGARGGHVASIRALHDIYDRSMKMLPDAFEMNRLGNIDSLRVIHNPTVPPDVAPTPREVAYLHRGLPVRLGEIAPEWFHDAMRCTRFTFERLQELCRGRDGLGLSRICHP